MKRAEPETGGAISRLAGGAKAFRTILAAVVLAIALAAAACLLPENKYQQMQLVDGTIYGQLRWIYERTHYDPTPIDVAIIGASRIQLGISAAKVQEQLLSDGEHANVANLAVVAAGQNLHWVIADELLKSKTPKVIVIGIDESPLPFGHPAFKYAAPASAVISPPQPLLHNYFKDLAYLPVRKVRLFAASLFPSLFGFSTEFDSQAYANTRTDYTSSFTDEFGKVIDMVNPVPAATLLAQPRPNDIATFASRQLLRFNEGDDHAYIREIAREAKAHGARLVFLYVPYFKGSKEISDQAFLEQFGEVLNFSDLAQDHTIYSNWSHLNHAGAMIVSVQLANAISRENLLKATN
jgi:hypothetical protein